MALLTVVGFAHPYLQALAGGLLIGISAGGFYLLSGKVAGVSTIFRKALTFGGGVWRWLFIAGLVLAGLIASQLLGSTATPQLLQSSPPLLAVSGVIVGAGAYFGAGCTSGHGVCGLARFSPRSLAAVVVFMTTAIATVFVTHHTGLGL